VVLFSFIDLPLPGLATLVFLPPLLRGLLFKARLYRIDALMLELSSRLASYSLALAFPSRSNPLGDLGGVPYGECKLDLSSSSLT
jgi:hypothetical protein